MSVPLSNRRDVHTRMHRPKQQQHERSTVGGRKLKYVLRVIQEPERARACGSGAKSSADRRPVDPPPVVELRIFDLKDGQEEDITFSYSANFFLFTTLEVSRPIANGRVHPPPPPQQVPVLTGMPVSGMAYLDRPNEAGYFIFPDLSVRHEGAYKLAFHLYEETKLADDATVESPDKKKPPVGPGAPDSSFDYVTEVKSREFAVYSAKRFPGLTESTALSRTVAEQGCRVRIRRDVRMRKRTDGKPVEGYEEAHEDYRGRAAEQDFQRERSYSGSPNSSPSSSPTRGNNEFPQPQYGPHSHPQQQNALGPHGHLGFATESPYANRTFQTPQAPVHQQYQQPQPQHPQHPQQPQHIASYPPQAPPQQYRPTPPPPPSYGYDRQYPQSAYPSNRPREVYEQEPRRSSVAYPPSHNARDYPPGEPFNRHAYQQAYNRPRSPPAALAPIKPAPQSSPLAPVHANAPLPSIPYDRGQERLGAYSQCAPQPIESAPRNIKRAFDTVFKSSSTAEPLFNGKRPVSSHANDEDLDDDHDLSALKMSYKRADGGTFTRKLPNLE